MAKLAAILFASIPLSTGAGDANLVELPRADHPELYTLRDASKRFDAELRARARQAARR